MGRKRKRFLNFLRHTAELLAIYATLGNGLLSEERKTLAVAFWNVENLFDTVDDPLKQDEDFTPSGRYHWTEEKLATKIENLSRVIKSMNADIVGLAEVENIEVLRRLARSAGYQNAYLIERGDSRGIDVGIISRLPLGDVKNFGHLRGYLTGNAIGLTFAFTHWKSKRGNEARTSEARYRQAAQATELRSPVLLMGDLNEEPSEKGRSLLREMGFTELTIDRDCRSFYSGARGECIDGAYLRQSPSDVCSIAILESAVFRESSINMRGQRRPDSGISDHWPLLIKIEVRCN